MTNLAPMLLGAALVCLGVLAAGLADRIRGARVLRALATPPPRRCAQTSQASHLDDAISAIRSGLERDIISALTNAGYSKAIATEAARAVPSNQAATFDSWMRAALKQCTRGEVTS